MQVLFPEINSRWCELPEAASKTRRALLHHAAKNAAILLPAHAAGLGGWHIVGQGDGFLVQLPDG
jgi:hypothetical protein